MFSHFVNPLVLTASLISPSKLFKVALPLMSLKLSPIFEFLFLPHGSMQMYYCLKVVKWDVDLRQESDSCSTGFSKTQIWTLHHHDISWSRYEKAEQPHWQHPIILSAEEGIKKVTMVHVYKSEAPPLFNACPNLPKHYIPESLSLTHIQLPFCTVCSFSIYCR